MFRKIFLKNFKIVQFITAALKSAPKLVKLQIYKVCKLHRVFHNLPDFAHKLCNVTNFGMLFNAVVMNCTFQKKFFLILPITQSVHSRRTSARNVQHYRIDRYKFHFTLLTKCCFCVCVDALKAMVGNSLRKCFNHFSTTVAGTRSE